MDQNNSDGNSYGWGDLLNTVKGLGETGAEVYRGINDNSAQPSASGAPITPASSFDASKLLPIGIIGAIVVIVLYFITRK